MTEIMWVPCVLEDVSIDTRFFMGGTNYTSPSDTDFQALFILPLPTMKGSMRLHVMGVKIGVFDEPSQKLAQGVYSFLSLIDSKSIGRTILGLKKCFLG
ncbi:MAG: hypothetical protein ACFFCP_09795, partial [Promethearchaeota archaeon]